MGGGGGGGGGGGVKGMRLAACEHTGTRWVSILVIARQGEPGL